MKNIVLITIISLILSALTATTIYDIQYTEDPSGDSPLEGQTVTVVGIVTATGYETSGNTRFFISDPEGGAWRGIYVFEYDNNISVGDEVQVEGEVSEYFGFTEIGYADVEVLSSGNAIPNPVEITTNEVNIEMYESVLVKVRNVTCTDDPDNYNQWYVDDDSGECQIDDTIYEYPNPHVNDEFYSITGVVDYSYSEFGVNPRSADDIIPMGVPIVEEISTDPIYPIINEDISVIAKVIDYERSITEVKIYYRYQGDVDFQIEDMNNIGNDEYEYTLSAITSEDEKYEVKIWAKDDDDNQTFSDIILIEILQVSPIISNLQVMNEPNPMESLLVNVNITDTDGIIIDAQLIYTLNYDNEVFYADLDTIGTDIYEGTIPGYSSGTIVNIGVTAEDDSSQVTMIYNLDSYTFPALSHLALLNIPAKAFNPYSGETFPIEFAAEEHDKAIMRIYNAEGKLMRTLVNGIISNSNGITHYDWNGRDKENNLLPLGLYICYLEVIDVNTGNKKTAKAPIVIGAPLK